MSTQNRLNNRVSTARDRAAVVSTRLLLASRKAALVGLGLAALTAGAAVDIATRLEERGEIAGLELRQQIDRALERDAIRIDRRLRAAAQPRLDGQPDQTDPG